jgi:hypothetical protein
MIGNYIKAVATAVSRSTAQLMKTGQTTSYRTGDDGDLEAGRSVSFTVLAENNVFGNTNRFTDELGTQTYTKNIVIDWSTYDGSTVLGWRRTTSQATWNNAIDGALVVSIAPFTSGWRLPNFIEVSSIINFQIAATGGLNLFNYSPFNIVLSFPLWCSNNSSGAAFGFNFSPGNIKIDFLAKANNYNWIPCRTFTVTGTTLS